MCMCHDSIPTTSGHSLAAQRCGGRVKRRKYLINTFCLFNPLMANHIILVMLSMMLSISAHKCGFEPLLAGICVYVG